MAKRRYRHTPLTFLIQIVDGMLVSLSNLRAYLVIQRGKNTRNKW
jgi:hypothetical protein